MSASMLITVSRTTCCCVFFVSDKNACPLQNIKKSNSKQRSSTSTEASETRESEKPQKNQLNNFAHKTNWGLHLFCHGRCKLSTTQKFSILMHRICCTVFFSWATWKKKRIYVHFQRWNSWKKNHKKHLRYIMVIWDRFPLC